MPWEEPDLSVLPTKLVEFLALAQTAVREKWHGRLELRVEDGTLTLIETHRQHK